MQEASILSDVRSAPWKFIPTLYFAQGLPFAAVTILSVVMYSSLGVSNSQMAFWTSCLSIPWVVKPLWSPLVEAWFPKRKWIWVCQFGLALLAFSIAPLVSAFYASLVLFYLMALLSATHDIAADGFYILGLEEKEQARFVGIRSTAFRGALIFVQGGLIWLCGTFQRSMGLAESWGLTLALFGAIMLSFGGWHRFTLPYPRQDRAVERAPLRPVIRAFFQREGIGRVLGFLLLYRLGEAQLTRMAVPFCLADRGQGGLGLSLEDIGIMMGGFGVGSLVLGGILGGLILAKWGLNRCLLPLWAALNVPNLLYLFLAYYQPTSKALIAGCIAFEQFGYGIGFAAYMLYMVRIAGEGEWKTSHYALATGFMALGLMVPGMFSGFFQEQLGYVGFFSWVLFCSIPCLLVIKK